MSQKPSQKNNRRQFVATSALASSFLFLPWLGRKAAERIATLTILEARERVERAAAYERDLGYEVLKLKLTALQGLRRRKS